MNTLARTLSVAAFSLCLAARAEPGFVSLFDGKTLNGWKETHKTRGPSYYVTNGVIASPANAANDLITDGTFADYILRLDFKLAPAGNNGIGIRVPFETNDLTYSGNEVQILDDNDSAYAHLDPGQYCGSLYKIFAARRGALNKAGDWNHYEITARGRRITVALNGQTIVDGNLNDVTNREVLRGHPGMLRESGHIALLGHWSHVEFRNIFIQELPRVETDNAPPEGFTALFNGHDLEGWQGLFGNPTNRAQMSAAELAAGQANADTRMRAHWHVQGSQLVYDGKGDNLSTTRNCGDFELLADWKIAPGGEGGICLRGVPLIFAGPPDGNWNRYRILVVGDKAHVFLNGQLTVRDATLKNIREPGKPLYPTGRIELQSGGSPLRFKNIYIRELPPLPAK